MEQQRKIPRSDNTAGQDPAGGHEQAGVRSTGKSLDVNLANMSRTLLSAMAERMFHRPDAAEDTTDSESDGSEPKDARQRNWKRHARSRLLPLVGEAASSTEKPSGTTRFTRELVLTEVPKNPWKLVSNSKGRKHSFEAFGNVCPTKRQRATRELTVNSLPAELSGTGIGLEGTLMELIDAEGQVVELRERPPGAGQFCCYADCVNPSKSSSFKKVQRSAGAGGFDWSPFIGRTLCNACYTRMSRRGTIVAVRAGLGGGDVRAKARKLALAGTSNAARSLNAARSFGAANAAVSSTGGGPTNVSSRCQVCFDAQSETDLCCSKCPMAVHEQCYLGSKTLRDKDKARWACEPCRMGLATEDLSCVLCPVKGGAFKGAEASKWAHLACAILIPGLYMMDDVGLDDIRGTENIPDACRDRLCGVCGQTDVQHPCVDCDHEDCTDTCHPLCGVQSGWEMQLVAEQDDVRQHYLCAQHAPSQHQQQDDEEEGGQKHASEECYDDDDEEEEEERIVCPVCALPWDGAQFMIRCDTCSEFCHGGCVMVSECRAQSMTRFACPNCPSQPQSRTRKRAAMTRGSDDTQQQQTTPDTPTASGSGGRALVRSERARGWQVSPGRRILFHWNAEETWEAVVVCRASELHDKAGAGAGAGAGGRVRYGADWWQVRRISNASSSKEVLLLAESNADRWELLSKQGDAKLDAFVYSRRKAEPYSSTLAAQLQVASGQQAGRRRPEKRSPPFRPVRVLCAGNGAQEGEVTHGVLRLSSKSSSKLVVVHQGRELALTEFEHVAGNSAKRPKQSIRVQSSGLSIGDYLARWDSSPEPAK